MQRIYKLQINRLQYGTQGEIIVAAISVEILYEKSIFFVIEKMPQD